MAFQFFSLGFRVFQVKAPGGLRFRVFRFRVYV